jgi:autotransporter adhesin
MNRIYQSVWNETTGAWVATSETARAKTKSGRSRKRVMAQAVLAGVALMGGMSVANAQSSAANYYFAVSGTESGIDNAIAAAGLNALAAGVNAHANQKDSIAIGTGAVADNTDSAAIGASAIASGRYAVALGYTATASLMDAVAIGHDAAATGSAALAAGGSASAAESGTAVGTGADAGYYATAVGVDTVASGNNSLALGNAARATRDNSVALGAGSATAIGAQTNYHGYALSAPQTSVGEVNIGNRTISGVAAGKDNEDAVNVAQLKAVNDGTVRYDPKGDGTPGTDDITLAGPTSGDGGLAGGTTISNLHQGDVSAASTDAINGAQLYGIAGDTSATYIEHNGSGVKYVRTNDTGMTPGDAHAAGLLSSAVGYNAQADSLRSVAIGSESHAIGEGSVAIGAEAAAEGGDSVALGHGAIASAPNSVALGAKSTTTADLALPAQSFGADPAKIAGATAAGEVSVGSADHERRVTNVAAGAAATDAVNLSQLSAVDSKIDTVNRSGTLHYFKAEGAADGTDDAIASGKQAVATGANASASADNATALGANAHASELDATALGNSATASGEGATAIGTHASAMATGSVALGNMASADKAGAIAIGQGAAASADGSIALGQGSVADQRDTVSIGSKGNERRITHVAEGVDATDAVNLSQLEDAIAGSVGKSHYFKAGGAEDGSDDALASGTRAVAMGSGAVASGEHSLAAGASSWADGTQSTAVGSYAQATAQNATAIGNQANASAANSVALGQGSIADRVNSVSVGSASNERQITNVAAGTADTDAVNVAQLNAVADQAAATAVKVDGAVMYDTNPDGSVNKTSITLGGDPAAGGTVIHNIANGVATTDAVNLGQLNDAIDGAISDISGNSGSAFFSANGDTDTEAAQSSGTHAVAGGANAQASGTNAVAIGANSVASGNDTTSLGAGANASADNSVALGQGSVADRASTVSVGAAGSERQITNVAAGVQGTDAVNVNQLNAGMGSAVGQANSYTDDKIRSARRDAQGGTASALAAAGLPQAVLPGRGMVAVAGGTYAGQSAIALGVSQLSETGKWVYKVQGTSDTRGQFGASVGAGMHW